MTAGTLGTGDRAGVARTCCQWWSAVRPPAGYTGSTPVGGQRPGEAASHPVLTHPRDTRGTGRRPWAPRSAQRREPRPSEPPRRGGCGYRVPGVRRAPGARPAVLDQLGPDAIAAWKTAGAAEIRDWPVTRAAPGAGPSGSVVALRATALPLSLSPGHCTGAGGCRAADAGPAQPGPRQPQRPGGVGGPSLLV